MCYYNVVILEVSNIVVILEVSNIVVIHEVSNIVGTDLKGPISITKFLGTVQYVYIRSLESNGYSRT